MDKLHIKRINNSEYIGLAVCVVIFMATCFIAGVGFYNDSYSYESMSTIREPVYPLFLCIFRSVFGKSVYLNIVIFIQNILAAFVIWIVALYLKKLFDFKLMGEIITYICLLAPYFITAVFSRTHLFITNSILTEGITVSIWLLFVKRIMQCVFEDEKKNIFIAIAYSVVLSLTRSQMQIAILLIAVVMVSKSIINKNVKQTLLLSFIQIIGSFGIVFLVTHLYFYALNGHFMSNTYGPQTKFSNVMYLAEEKDAELFEDAETRQVFETAYKTAIENGYNKKYSKKGLFARAQDIENSHDPLKAECLAEALNTHNEKVGITDGLEKALENDRIASEIRSVLLKEHFAEWCYDYIALSLYGFIRSVGIVNKWINIYVFIVYLFAIALSIFVWKKNKSDKSPVFMAIILLCICANVFATSLYIMCLSRYMIYNLPFFYIGCVALLKDFRYKSEEK